MRQPTRGLHEATSRYDPIGRAMQRRQVRAQLPTRPRALRKRPVDRMRDGHHHRSVLWRLCDGLCGPDRIVHADWKRELHLFGQLPGDYTDDVPRKHLCRYHERPEPLRIVHRVSGGVERKSDVQDRLLWSSLQRRISSLPERLCGEYQRRLLRQPLVLPLRRARTRDHSV